MRSGDGTIVITDDGRLPSAPGFANPYIRLLMENQIAGSELIVNFTYILDARAGNSADGFFVDSVG